MREIRQVLLAEVTPGTELATPLKDAKGRILFSAGTALGERQLEQLARRGIETLPVWVTVAASAAESDRRRRDVIDRLNHRFRKVEGNALMASLKEHVLRHLLNREGL